MGRHFTGPKFNLFIIEMLNQHNEDNEERMAQKNLIVRYGSTRKQREFSIEELDKDACIPTSIDDYPENPVYAVAKVSLCSNMTSLSMLSLRYSVPQLKI